MAISEYNYIPTYIKRTINNKPKDVIRANYWNELFNLLINQGDHTAKELGNVLNHFTAAINEVKGVADGKYVKPTDGVPKTDLAAAVQTSLDKADTALQTHQSLAAYRTAFAQDVIDSDLGDRISAIENKESGWNDKQDKLIAGDNITIAADGKTISAIGGSSASIAMRVNGGYIQYSTDNGNTWSNLIAEADIKGDKGDTGPQGPIGDKGDPGADGISLYTTTQDSALETTPFDIIYITTNDRTLVVGDLILTPTGRLYRVTSVSTSFVDAEYITSLRGPQGIKGDKGDTGPKGEQGPSGVSPTISLEETASGVLIDVTDATGTSTAYVLNGQSAYEAAQAGGYTGTKAELAEKLAQEQLTATTSTLTPTQVYEAVSAGVPVKVQYLDDTYGLISFTAFVVSESLNMIVSNMIAYANSMYILVELFGNKSNNSWGFNTATLAQKTDIPSDGHINSLIDAKLGVIENGSY